MVRGEATVEARQGWGRATEDSQEPSGTHAQREREGRNERERMNEMVRVPASANLFWSCSCPASVSLLPLGRNCLPLFGSCSTAFAPYAIYQYSN